MEQFHRWVRFWINKSTLICCYYLSRFRFRYTWLGTLCSWCIFITSKSHSTSGLWPKWHFKSFWIIIINKSSIPKSRLLLLPPVPHLPSLPFAVMNSSSINHSCFSALSQLICLPMFPFLFHQAHMFLPFFLSFPLTILPACTLLSNHNPPPYFSLLFIWSWLSS